MPRIGGYLPPAVAQPVWVKRNLDWVTILIVGDEQLIRLDLQQKAVARVLSDDGAQLWCRKRRCQKTSSLPWKSCFEPCAQPSIVR